MDKLRNLLRRVKSGSFSRMFRNAEYAANEFGKSKVLVLIDMCYCILRYNIGYLDYFIFGFANKDAKKRKTYITYNHNIALFKMMDDKELSFILKDKLAFNERYREFIGRDFFDPSKHDINEFNKFLKGKRKLFIKPSDSFGGLGEYKPIEVDGNTDVEELYNHLKQNKLFIEDMIVQHPKMSLLSKSSINTVRIVTLVVNNKAHYVYSVLRMGVGDMKVDNSSSGGLNTCLDENGRIMKACFSDKTVKYYTKHPTTGMELVGFEVPMFKQAVDLCLKAAMIEPRLGYIGFDVAIGENGPLIVEANDLPGYDMPQNHGTNNSDIGILPKFEELLGRKIEL